MPSYNYISSKILITEERLGRESNMREPAMELWKDSEFIELYMPYIISKTVECDRAKRRNRMSQLSKTKRAAKVQRRRQKQPYIAVGNLLLLDNNFLVYLIRL